MAVAIACLLALAGCGGSGALGDTYTATYDDEPVQVKMSVNAHLDVETEFELVGGSTGKAQDLADVTTEIVFDPGGTGQTAYGASILQGAQIYPDDCPSPPGPSACIKCMSEYKVLDQDGVTWRDDPTLSNVVGTCSGNVPGSYIGLDTIPVQFIFHAGIATAIPTAGNAMIRGDGSSQADYLASDLADIYLETSDDYVLTGCDGNPDPAEITMSLAEPVIGAYDQYDQLPDGTIKWTKGFTISNMGQPDPQTGYNTCDFDTVLDGDLPIQIDSSIDTVRYAVKFCTDKQSCTAFGAGGYLDTGPMEFFEGLSETLDGNDDAMLMPNFWLSFATGMWLDSLNMGTIVLDSPDLGFGIPEPTYTIASVGRQDSSDGILNDDFFLTFDEGSVYMYQLHDFIMMLWDIRSLNNEKLDRPFFLEFSSGCAISDEFAKISKECYRPDVTMTNEPFTPTFSDWQSIDSAVALSFNTTTASVLKYSDLNKTVGQEESVRIEKLVLPNSKWRVEARLLGLAGIDDADSNGYADFIRFGVVDSNYSGYMIGVEGIYDGKAYIPSCFAVRYLNGAVQEGAYVNCDKRSDILLQLSHQSSYSDIVARVSFDGGAGWTDIEASGSLYPGASTTSLTYVTQIQDHSAILEGMSRANATANDNYVNIDRIRWYGIYNSNNALVDQYVDTDFTEIPPS